MNKKERLVAAIEHGTVIDHILCDKLFQVVSLLHLEQNDRDAITIGMNLFPPLFQQIFTDHIITGKNPEWFGPLIGFYCTLFVVELVAWLVLNGQRRKLAMRFSLISQARYIWHALRLPMAAHSRYSSGDLIARFMGIGTTGVKLFDMAPTLVLLLNVVIF